MPALEKRLDGKGWTRNFTISLRDETFAQYARSRVALAKFIRAIARKIKFVDANRNTDQSACFFGLGSEMNAFSRLLIHSK
ncbi:MAG TPA: hypothetical protein PLE19_01000 [Planctomycetota bacterium]|nr:hypothetical protein [Planctomycetota bacterium]HRR80665.1 hypothetical protein [Planctomycetota bacterium]HRT93253.1 hypothetical protein [Planctomycetota bacterium]